MLDDRKTNILRAVVQEYISTGQPVGSSHISRTAGLKVSSATVRNEMAVLEQEGYLVQPHTSAGRVPTDKGYRLFVDSIAQTSEQGRVALGSAAYQQVGEFFGAAHGRIEELLRQTSTLLADLTKYTALVLGPKAEVVTVRHIHMVRLSSKSATVVVVLSNGAIENEIVSLSDDVDDSHLDEASRHLQANFVGRTMADRPQVSASGNATVDSLCAVASSALESHGNSESVFVGGASSLANSFDAVDVVRDVLRTLEQQYVVVSLVRDVIDRGLTVAIGAEHGVEPLAACSVVVAPVVADGEALGSIGILGPTRMNYPQALATVEVVSDKLGRHLVDN